MSEEEINKIVKEHYGFTVEEIDNSVGEWCIRYGKEREKRKQLQQENSQLKEDIKGLQCERQTLYNTIHDIQKANKQLNRKREKAIEYINENTRPEYRNGRANEFYLELNESELKELLEILKGDKE